MEIVNRGVDPGDEVMAGKCLRCKSTLKAKRSELTPSTHAAKSADDEYSTGLCPVCGYAVSFYAQAG